MNVSMDFHGRIKKQKTTNILKLFKVLSHKLSFVLFIIN